MSRFSVGDKLGPYEILAPIGTGGMGEVYRARDTRLHREVAIKVVRGELARKPDLRASKSGPLGCRRKRRHSETAGPQRAPYVGLEELLTD